MFSGYTSTTSAEYDVYAQYGAPMFHLNTFQAERRLRGRQRRSEHLPLLPDRGSGTDQASSSSCSGRSAGAWTAELGDGCDRHEQRPVQHHDRADGPFRARGDRLAAPGPRAGHGAARRWGRLLAKIGRTRRADLPRRLHPRRPRVVPASSRSEPTPSLMYQQYGPSIPEYLELAGDDADGVIWSTVIGTCGRDGRGVQGRLSVGVRRAGRPQPGRWAVRPRSTCGRRAPRWPATR